MTVVSLPSVIGAKSLEDVIDSVENMRKTVEFLLENIQDDNINGVISANKISIGPDTTYAEGYNPSLIGSNTGGDGQEFLWFYNGVPGSTVDPEKNWTDDTTRNSHVGDLYYDLTTKYCYRYKVENTNVFSWERLMDSDIQTAMDKAAGAQDTADHKRRVFVNTPVPPYDVGDLWAAGGTGDLNRCNTAKAVGQSYDAADWGLATKYTDDTVANSAMNAVNGFQSQLDGKVEVWYYAGAPTTSNAPASSWTDNPTKDKHVGDLYYDTSTKYAYRYKADYTWEKIQDQDIGLAMQTAGSKRRIFTATPTPPYDVGDLWVGTTGNFIKHCTTARASGSYVGTDWTMTGMGTFIDATGVYTGKVVADNVETGSISSTDGSTVFNLDDGSFRMGGAKFFRIGNSDTDYKIKFSGNVLDVNGRLTTDSIMLYNPNASTASVAMSWLNNQARIRVGGTGTGSSGGLEIQGLSDKRLLYVDNNGNVVAGNDFYRMQKIMIYSSDFLNGWSNYGSVYSGAGYYKFGNRVFLSGMIAGGTVNTTAFILPSGYRPNESKAFSTIAAGPTAVMLTVSSSGGVYTVNATSSTWVSLEGISFETT